MERRSTCTAGGADLTVASCGAEVSHPLCFELRPREAAVGHYFYDSVQLAPRDDLRFDAVDDARQDVFVCRNRRAWLDLDREHVQLVVTSEHDLKLLTKLRHPPDGILDGAGK